jgi:hypothetical protein
VGSYECKIKRRFRLMAVFYDLFELAFGLSSRPNPRQALAAKIPDSAPRILDVRTGTTSSSI